MHLVGLAWAKLVDELIDAHVAAAYANQDVIILFQFHDDLFQTEEIDSFRLALEERLVDPLLWVLVEVQLQSKIEPAEFARLRIRRGTGSILR